MKLVDVHCHLNHQEFKEDFSKVLERAKQAGVAAILVSGVNPAGNKEVVELIKKDEILHASLGIYPIDALGLSEGETGLPQQQGTINLEEQFSFIEKNKEKVAAIGEIGMDFHWADKDTQQQQEENFKKIISFANKINKPIIIHSRKAEKECLDLLEQAKVPVDLHCFGGNKKLVRRAAELGFYFSIPPIIVKLQHFQMIVEMVPLTQLLTETDAPWLSYKEGRNEPAFVLEAVKKIAEIKELSTEKVAKQIWKNYESFVGMPSKGG